VAWLCRIWASEGSDPQDSDQDETLTLTHRFIVLYARHKGQRARGEDCPLFLPLNIESSLAPPPDRGAKHLAASGFRPLPHIVDRLGQQFALWQPVSIRIQTIPEVGGTVIKIDGQLRMEDVAELGRVVQSAQGAKALELSELRSADRAGAEILRELVSRGATVRGASPYMQLLLQTKP
jgi:hypothetical protein